MMHLLDYRTVYFRNIKVGYTNAEVIAMTDASSENYGMPYIYDSFNWEHCSEDFYGMLQQQFDNVDQYRR